MLSQTDEAIVARDAALPGLRLALDPSALSAALGLPKMRPIYLRYKPGTSCVASLVPVSGENLRAVGVMAYLPERFAEVRDRREWLDGPTPAIFHDSACIVVVPLARDRGLKGARRIADPQRGHAFLRKLAGEDVTGDVRLLRYKVGRRLVVSIGDFPHRALVKAYTKHDFAAALEGARIAEALGGAPILGVSQRRQCIAWRWLDATPLSPETRRSADWQAAGRALASVHRASVRGPATLGRSEEVTELATVEAALNPLSPDLACMVAPVVTRTIRQLMQTAFTQTLIHGDFSADQVLIRETKATLIDWDRAATGDPARDLGTFLARLDVQQLGEGVEISGAVNAFIEGYTAAGGPAQAPAIALQRARALLTLLTEGFRQRWPDWPQLALRLMARADALLDEEQALPRPLLLDPGMPALDTALATGTMAPLLGKTLSRDVRSVESELLRHKHGRRALIRYRIESSGDQESLVLLGKIQAKGPDARTPALHAALRAQGLDGRAPGGVGVPAPHGCIAAPALWLQEEVSGCSLEVLLQPGADCQPAARTGAALAGLHMAAVPAHRQWSMADELGVLERALDSFRARMRARTTQIDAIADAAASVVHSLAPTATTAIHRDFYPEQVLVDDKTIWLLDFDLYAEGDPAIDLANFLAHLDELGLRRHGDLTALVDHGKAFLDAYDTVRPGIDRRRVQRLRFVALARHINLSQIVPGRGHTTSTLIDHCAAAVFTMENDERTTSA